MYMLYCFLHDLLFWRIRLSSLTAFRLPPLSALLTPSWDNIPEPRSDQLPMGASRKTWPNIVNNKVPYAVRARAACVGWRMLLVPPVSTPRLPLCQRSVLLSCGLCSNPAKRSSKKLRPRVRQRRFRRAVSCRVRCCFISILGVWLSIYIDRQRLDACHILCALFAAALTSALWHVLVVTAHHSLLHPLLQIFGQPGEVYPPVRGRSLSRLRADPLVDGAVSRNKCISCLPNYFKTAHAPRAKRQRCTVHSISQNSVSRHPAPQKRCVCLPRRSTRPHSDAQLELHVLHCSLPCAGGHPTAFRPKPPQNPPAQDIPRRGTTPAAAHPPPRTRVKRARALAFLKQLAREQARHTPGTVCAGASGTQPRRVRRAEMLLRSAALGLPPDDEERSPQGCLDGYPSGRVHRGSAQRCGQKTPSCLARC